MKCGVEFILKASAPYGLTAHTGSRRVAALNHKIFYYTVENKTVIITVFSVCSEIFYCFGCFVWEKFYFNITHRCMHYCNCVTRLW